MEMVFVNQAREHVGDEITIAGWVTHYRSSGKIHFIIVRDGTGVMQCVVKTRLPA